MNYETVIGLEIHAELATQTKLFCGCPNNPFHAPEPNLYICPICLGLPGTLPVMNRQAVSWSALVGLAIGCEIGWVREEDANQRFTKWDRKNYFYPDLPKGYQISQYDLPIDRHGSLEVDGTSIAITRIHLEEDTGKIVHAKGVSLLDFNRAGVPLLELVTEPVIRSGTQASAFAQLYQLVLRTLGVATADMEKGEMRVEANISVRPVGTETFGTKVEVKNLNSFKSVEKAIVYETNRQITAIESGEPLVQETRGWDETKQRTFVQRIKETAADYRYFPEPDLPPVTFTKHQPADVRYQGLVIDDIHALLPELPWEKKTRYLLDGIPAHDADRLIRNIREAQRFDQLSREQNLISAEKKLLASWLVNGMLYQSDQNFDWQDLDFLLRATLAGEITTKNAKEVLEKWQSTGQSPRAIIETAGLAVVRDGTTIEQFVRDTLGVHPQAVLDYRAGKPQALGFLIGQVMAKSRGQADPGVVRAALLERLKEE